MRARSGAVPDRDPVKPADLSVFLERHAPETRRVVVALREVVRRAAPKAEESLLWGGVSYHRPWMGGRVRGAVCQIGVRGGRARLDFIHGVRLGDPRGLLVGDRLSKRFVWIDTEDDARRPEVAALIRAAAEFDPAEPRRASKSGGRGRGRGRTIRAMTWMRLSELGRELPGVEESSWYGTPSLAVRGKSFVRLKEDGETVVFMVEDLDERDLLLRTRPHVYFLTEHYRDSTAVLARLAKLTVAECRARLEVAWRTKAPAALLATVVRARRPSRGAGSAD